LSDNEKFINEKGQEIFRHFRLGEHLMQGKKISLYQLNDALVKQQATGKLIGEIFVENGYITIDELQEGLMQQDNADEIIINLTNEIKDKISFKKVDQ